MSKEAKRRAAKERRAKRKQPKKRVKSTRDMAEPKRVWTSNLASIDVHFNGQVKRVSLNVDAPLLIEKYGLTGEMIHQLASLHGGYPVAEDDDISRKFVELGLMTENPTGWFHRTPMWEEVCSKMFRVEVIS